ncbi:Kinesin light chain [Diplonema papillatum]|nr:Kinesin light chain [Diplonema papillatum]
MWRHARAVARQARQCGAGSADVMVGHSATTEKMLQQLTNVPSAELRETRDRLFSRGRTAAAERHIDIRKRRKQVARFASLLNCIGETHQNLNEFSEARKCFDLELKLRLQVLSEKEAQRDSSVAATHSSMSTALQQQGRLEDAERHSNRALATFEKLEDSPKVANSLNNLGMLKLQMDRPSEALTYFEKSIELKLRHIKSKRGPASADESLSLARSLFNVGVVQRKLGDTDKAAELLDRSLAIVRRADPNSWTEAAILRELGGICEQRDRLEEALRHYEAELSIRSQAAPDRGQVCESWVCVGRVLFAQKRHDLSVKAYEAAVRLADEGHPLDASVKADILLALGAQHRALGDSETAFPCFERSFALRRAYPPRIPLASDAVCSYNLASLCCERGRANEAIFYLRDAITGMRESGSPLLKQSLEWVISLEKQRSDEGREDAAP